MRIALVLFLLVATAPAGFAQDMFDVVQKSQSNSQYYSDTIQVPDSVRNGTKGMDEAQKSADYVNSEAFNQAVEKEKSRLQQEVFGVSAGVSGGYYEDLSGVDGKKRALHLSADERIYIFVSSSIPEATLRVYARDLERLGTPNAYMVMRGMIGGMKSFQPTMSFLSRVLLRDPDCGDIHGCPSFAAAVEIDPMVFRQFHPERVPAIVYVKGVNTRDLALSDGDPANSSNPLGDSWWMVYGDTSLSHVLETIGDESGVKKLQDAAIFLR